MTDFFPPSNSTQIDFSYIIVYITLQDLVDWSKPLFPQVASIGEHYDEWVHSPVNRKLKLFNSDLLEFLSKSPWWLVPLVWIPFVIYTCWLSLTAAPTYVPTLSPAPVPGRLDLIFLPLGLLLWTFIEYSLHRFVFHLRVPHTGLASKILLPLHFTMHGLHHKVSTCRETINNAVIIVHAILHAIWSCFATS